MGIDCPTEERLKGVMEAKVGNDEKKQREEGGKGFM